MYFHRLITPVLTLTMISMGISSVAQAGMVGTAQVITSQKAETERDKLNIILHRNDVVAELKHLGVDPKQAQERANSLTDDEVLTLANKIDQLPAGGDSIGGFFGAAVIIFFVILIIAILDYTGIYRFVHHHAN
jgi:hypothetical protein